VSVHFDQPDESNFLRLNMGSNGWTNANLSQYYDDLAVQYRRMDHWNNFLGPIRRRPDGGLWFDYWALDHAIYEGTGGFRCKPYPAVDYSPPHERKSAAATGSFLPKSRASRCWCGKTNR
jgi:hypothetical protein